MDLVADNSGGLQKQKSSYHWDKRHKKYVKLNNEERMTASGKVKTEGGAKVKSRKTGICKRWKERSHNKVSLKGRNNVALLKNLPVWEVLADFLEITKGSEAERSIIQYPMLMYGQKLRILNKFERKGKRR